MAEQSPRYLYVALEHKARPVVAPLHEPLTWTKSAAQHLSQGGGRLELTTDTSEGSYQAISQAIPVPAGAIPIVDLQGTVHEGAIAIGMLNESEATWLGVQSFPTGPIKIPLRFNTGSAQKVTLVISNVGLRQASRVSLEPVRIRFILTGEDSSPLQPQGGCLQGCSLKDVQERHKIKLDLPVLSPLDDPLGEVKRQELHGVILALYCGLPGPFFLKLTKQVLRMKLPVWFYWPRESALEYIDWEKLESYWRHRVFMQLYSQTGIPLQVLWGVGSRLRQRLPDLLPLISQPRRAARAASYVTQRLFGRSQTNRPPAQGAEENGTSSQLNIAARLAEIKQLAHQAAPVPFRFEEQPDRQHPLKGTGIYLRTDFWAKIEAGGSYGHTCYVAKELAAITERFVTYLPHRYALLDDMGVRQVVLQPPSPFAPEEEIVAATDHYYPQLKSALKERNPCYIYERICLGNYTGVKLSQELGLPYIVEYNGSEISMRRSFDGQGYRYEKVYLEAERAAFEQATLISVVSEPIKEDLVRRGVAAQKILVNPNGVDPDVYKPLPEAQRNKLRQTLAFDTAHCVIGFTGTFGGWHGIDVLAEAIPRICEQCPEARFLLIGDGNYKHLVDTQVSTHRLTDRVRRMGRVPQKEGARLLSACDIYVSPHSSHMVDSKFFGSPTKIFEYMAMGQGIVASDLEQIGQVLSPALRPADWIAAQLAVTNQRAVLCVPGKVDEFVEAVVQLVRYPEIGQTLGANARQAVLRQYSWRQHVANLWLFALGEDRRSGIQADPKGGEWKPSAISQVKTNDVYKDEAQNQWDNDPCGSHYVKDAEWHSLAWFLEAEAYRYGEYAPWMKEIMEFAQYDGKEVLEIGGGMGADLCQFALHGARVTDVDLSIGHLSLARKNFQLRNLPASFLHGDAEHLPFEDNHFDLVYSNGVIHHTPQSKRVVKEIHRILKPGGRVITMFYAENSLHYWAQLVSLLGIHQGLLKHHSMGEVMSRYVELSPGGAKPLVKVYTKPRLRRLFQGFTDIRMHQRQLIESELPPFLRGKIPLGLAGKLMGWNLIIKANKPGNA